MSTNPLEKYPRPGVTVDLAILTVADAAAADPQLCVLIQDRSDPDGHALPGAFIRERRTVDETVVDIFDRKIGISPAADSSPRLLKLFDDPRRDDRTWVISAGYSLSVQAGELAGARGTLVPISDDGALVFGEPLLFDHDEIVAGAVRSVRERYEFRHRYSDTMPDPDGFLPAPFTLHQLRKVHEAVVGKPMHKDNFTRRMRPYLEPVLDAAGEPVLAENLRGRPAALYRKFLPQA